MKKEEGGRLRARPLPVDSGADTAPSSPADEPGLSAGLHTLLDNGSSGGTGEERRTLLYVPAGHSPARPAPLIVSLHGAGGSAQHGLDLLIRFADTAGFLLLAPQSSGPTWDLLLEDYGPDAARINGALSYIFARCAVDTQRLAIGGFSDGASYALSLGIVNGDLFTHILAFSPGFMAPAARRGQPRLFLSHGTGDGVLPIDRCSRRIVPQARRAGYEVVYREFDGPHTVPEEIAREAVEWFVR